jgi:hypothetical protein
MAKTVEKTTKKKTKKAKKTATKRGRPKKEKSLGIDDSISLSDFLEQDGDVLLLAGSKEDLMNEECGRIISFMFRKFVSDINSVTKKFDTNIEVKTILKL